MHFIDMLSEIFMNHHHSWVSNFDKLVPRVGGVSEFGRSLAGIVIPGSKAIFRCPISAGWSPIFVNSPSYTF